jgi:hypothetical protein
LQYGGDVPLRRHIRRRGPQELRVRRKL